MLADRREELTRQRVQTVNRLQRLLSELTPGQAKKDITALQAKAILARVRPRDIAGKTRRGLAAEQLTELVAVEKKIKILTAELKTMVLARRSTLMDLPGVGPIVAARVLADVGEVTRFADRNRFASWTGTAPLDASSGEQIRHRLLAGGEPTDEPHAAHRRGHPGPARHRRPHVLPTQAGRREDSDGGHALPQAKDLRRGLPTTPRRCPSSQASSRPSRLGTHPRNRRYCHLSAVRTPTRPR
jgi:hypothetical protein